MTEKYASVDPISKDIEWSAKAALGDAMSRIGDNARLCVIWLDEENRMSYSKACTSETAVFMLTAAISQWVAPRD